MYNLLIVFKYNALELHAHAFQFIFLICKQVVLNQWYSVLHKDI